MHAGEPGPLATRAKGKPEARLKRTARVMSSVAEVTALMHSTVGGRFGPSGASAGSGSFVIPSLKDGAHDCF